MHLKNHIAHDLVEMIIDNNSVFPSEWNCNIAKYLLYAFYFDHVIYQRLISELSS